MKKLVLFSVFFALAFILWNCEKDDICDPVTPTTPKMIVEFYDNNNATVKKTVNDLAIVGEGLTEGILFDGVSKIEVPLKITDDVTRYSFILDAENPIVSLRNEDKLEINYTRDNVFISRACGYKTLFTLANPNGINLTADPNNWIKEITIQHYNIANEDEVHVKIFF